MNEGRKEREKERNDGIPKKITYILKINFPQSLVYLFFVLVKDLIYTILHCNILYSYRIIFFEISYLYFLMYLM